MTVPSLATIPTFGRAGFSKQGTVVAPTTFVEDACLGTAGVDLTTRAGEKGATWSLVTGFTGVLVETDANRIRKSGTTSAAYVASGLPAAANYDVEADFVIFSLISGDATAITGRQDPAANTCVRGQNAATGGQWQLTQFVTGTSTSLGTFNQGAPSGTIRMKLQFRDTTVKMFLDGVEKISGTTTVTAAGQLGLRNAGTVTQANGTGIHIDNIVGTNV